jgi:hypothetical protein
MSEALEFVICRGYPGHKCGTEHAKWKHPYCRKCWKAYYKKHNYIETREEIEKYCTK